MIVISSCSWLWPIHWSQVLSWEWRCSWSSADRRCSNYIWVINNFIANSDATYIRGLTVYRITDNTMQYNRYHKRWDHRPISQIPQCINCSTMHHFVTEMCIEKILLTMSVKLLSSMREDFNYLHHLRAQKWRIRKYLFQILQNGSIYTKLIVNIKRNGDYK